MPLRRAVVGVVSALLGAGGVALADSTPRQALPPSAQAAQSCALVGAAADFDVFSNGVWVASNTTLSGRAAAAGAVEISSIDVGGLTADQFDLIAGASVTASNGTLHGGVRYGDQLNVEQSFAITGERSRGDPPFSFDDEFTHLAQLSSELGSLPASPGTSVVLQPWGALEFTVSGSTPDRYVFAVSGAQLASAQGFSLSLPPGSTAVINVTGPTVSVTQAQYMGLTGIAPDRIVWNFAQTSAFTLGGSVAWQGTVLAPRADVTVTGNQNLYGQLIAANARTNHLAIVRTPFTGCLPTPPDEPLQLDGLCVDPAGNLSFKLRNIGDRDRDARWEDLDSAQAGSFTARAGHDRYFHVDAADGQPHRVRVTAGTETVEATGGTRRCSGQITVTHHVTGSSPGGQWTIVLTGPQGRVAEHALGAGESFTATVPGGYVDGSVPVGELPGGIPYLVSEPDPRGGVASISEMPITITDGDQADAGVATLYRLAPEATPTPQPTATATPTPTPPITTLPSPPTQPTLPPGAPDPPPGPDLIGPEPGQPAADVTVTHTVTPSTFTAGTILTVVTRVRNQGPLPAHGVVARELPQYRKLRADQVAHIISLTAGTPQRATATRRADTPACTQRRPVRCELGTLAPGQQVEITARVRVLIPGELHSTLLASSISPDSNRTNNASIANLTSRRPPQVVRAEVSAPPSGRVGARYAYRVSVTARERTARAVRLCTRLPATFTSRSAPGTFRWRARTCRDYRDLRRGQTRGFLVYATPAAGGRVTLNATAAAVGTPRISRASAPARIIGGACAATARRVRC